MTGRSESRRLLSRMLWTLRRPIRLAQWRREYRRIEELRSLGEGRRAFVVGNGPSLKSMDLDRLRGEFVCVANMGIRAVGDQLPHADMHVVADTNRYLRFAEEIEALAERHRVPIRFLTRRARHLHRRHARGARPYLLTARRALHPDYALTDIADSAAVLALHEGLPTARSVLPAACIILHNMGFRTICVIGCDLDYGSGGKYFYETGMLDAEHEEDERVIAARRNALEANEDFAIVNRAMEREGGRILNAGVGGRLETLPRVEFEGVWDGV